jgi:hypothetical protein
VTEGRMVLRVHKARKVRKALPGSPAPAGRRVRKVLKVGSGRVVRPVRSVQPARLVPQVRPGLLVLQDPRALLG